MLDLSELNAKINDLLQNLPVSDEILNRLYRDVEDLITAESEKEKYGILDSNYGLLSDYPDLDDTLSCGCRISVDLDEIELSRFSSNKLSADIDYCDEHEGNDDYKEELNKLAFDIWLKDESAKWSPRYRKLFELADL